MAAQPQGGELGALLRRWRALRGKSQLDLSLDAGLSQRHLSFVEIGRSAPSRAMLIDLAIALDMPLRDRNTLLLAGGYAPIYPDADWNAPEMQGISAALARMLRQHEPFPALVLDRYWTVLMANEAAPRFFGRLADLAAHPKPRNLLDLLFDPHGLRPAIGNWPAVAESLIQRIYRESVGRVMDEKTAALIARLRAYPDVDPHWHPPASLGAAAVLPVIAVEFLCEGRRLRYFSMVSTVGTPQTVAAQELRVECMFPADEETETRHRALMADGGFRG